jgi:hypothetical protein
MAHLRHIVCHLGENSQDGHTCRFWGSVSKIQSCGYKLLIQRRLWATILMSPEIALRKGKSGIGSPRVGTDAGSNTGANVLAQREMEKRRSPLV